MKKKFVIFTMSKKKNNDIFFSWLTWSYAFIFLCFVSQRFQKFMLIASYVTNEQKSGFAICYFSLFFFYNLKQYFNLIIPLRAIIMRNIQNTQYKFKVISSNITWNEVCFSLTYEELLTLKNDNNPLLKVLVYIPCLKLSLYIYI